MSHDAPLSDAQRGVCFKTYGGVCPGLGGKSARCSRCDAPTTATFPSSPSSVGCSTVVKASHGESKEQHGLRQRDICVQHMQCPQRSEYGKFDCEDREEAGTVAATRTDPPSLVASLLALVETVPSGLKHPQVSGSANGQSLLQGRSNRLRRIARSSAQATSAQRTSRQRCP